MDCSHVLPHFLVTENVQAYFIPCLTWAQWFLAAVASGATDE